MPPTDLGPLHPRTKMRAIDALVNAVEKLNALASSVAEAPDAAPSGGAAELVPAALVAQVRGSVADLVDLAQELTREAAAAAAAARAEAAETARPAGSPASSEPVAKAVTRPTAPTPGRLAIGKGGGVSNAYPERREDVEPGPVVWGDLGAVARRELG